MHQSFHRCEGTNPSRDGGGKFTCVVTFRLSFSLVGLASKFFTGRSALQSTVENNFGVLLSGSRERDGNTYHVDFRPTFAAKHIICLIYCWVIG
jgi:hypothetical protein